MKSGQPKVGDDDDNNTAGEGRDIVLSGVGSSFTIPTNLGMEQLKEFCKYLFFSSS